MKVVTPKIMAETEAKAGQEEAFMERAGEGIAACVHHYIDRHNLEKQVTLLCGKGNNSGDAYVAGTLLLKAGYQVKAIQLVPTNQKNYDRFLENGGKVEERFTPPKDGVILDALFGTGFHGTLDEPFASAIDEVNRSNLPVIAIDIPSGLNGDTGIAEGSAILADQTIFLGLPKTGFFLNDGWNHIGTLESVDFGLPESFTNEVNAPFLMLTEEDMEPLVPPIVRNRHKYDVGNVVGLAGSPSMPGAALLSSLSALRGGAGMLHLLHPPGMEAELSSSPYEVIKVPYSNAKEALEKLNKGKAVFVGPGLGKTKEMAALLNEVIPQLEVPTVIDADALALYDFPKQTILTPHHGEMERLLPNFDMESCQQFAVEKNVTLVLKGAPTFIFHPGELPHVNPTGCPGMATAGSGDVLTGLIAALLAQGLKCHEAACLGVYLHGLAGQHAEQEFTPFSMMASDIINAFPEAYRFEEV